MKKVFISTSSFGLQDQAPLKRLQKEKVAYELNPYRKTMTTEQLIAHLKGAKYLIAGVEKITAEVFKQHPQLKVISRCGAGLDNIDMQAARKHKVTCLATPQAPVLSVAELTLAMILGALRGINFADREIRLGRWNKPMGRLLAGKTVGIVGWGKIGKKVSELLKPFKVKILTYDIARGNFNQLLKQSDIVTLHLPLTAKTRHLINQKALRLMKKGAILINTSRGGIVDEEALFHALKDKVIAGAALDVMEQEPYQGPLAQIDNVILTPHMGSYTAETRSQMENEAVINLLKAAKAC